MSKATIVLDGAIQSEDPQVAPTPRVAIDYQGEDGFLWIAEIDLMAGPLSFKNTLKQAEILSKATGIPIRMASCFEELLDDENDNFEELLGDEDDNNE